VKGSRSSIPLHCSEGRIGHLAIDLFSIRLYIAVDLEKAAMIDAWRVDDWYPIAS
jgi:hypothetical protein